MEKYIKGRYRVADCETFNDVFREAQYLRSIGCIVDETYWDRRDCGEAYVDFRVRESRFPTVYKVIQSCATFEADINDYIKQDFVIDGFIYVENKEFHSLLDKHENDFSDGFEKRIPINFFFDKKNNVDSNHLIKEILSNFKTYNPIGYNIMIVDGVTYISLLFTIDYMELQYDTFKKIGDYSLSYNNYLIKSYGLYGQCRPNHKTFDLCNFDYEFTRRLVDKILKKEDISYKRTLLRNPRTTLQVPYNDYIKNGILERTIRDNDGYYYEFNRFSLKN